MYLKVLLKEAIIWRQLRHPNIMPLCGICQDQFAPQFALVSPWMKNGTLSQYLLRNPDADRVKMVCKPGFWTLGCIDSIASNTDITGCLRVVLPTLGDATDCTW